VVVSIGLAFFDRFRVLFFSYPCLLHGDFANNTAETVPTLKIPLFQYVNGAVALVFGGQESPVGSPCPAELAAARRGAILSIVDP